MGKIQSYKELLWILLLTGIVLMLLGGAYTKLERTIAKAEGMWWEDCPGAQFCSPVSPLPQPIQPTLTPLPTYVPLLEPTCLPTPTCPAPQAPAEPMEYPTQEPYPTYTPWPTQPPLQ